MATQSEATLPAEGGARPKATNPEIHPGPERRVKGPTLSTSTSSFEALDPHDPQLNHLASVMFSKSADWISGELSATIEDYKLLEKMNK
jgi:biogenesis of lysosome-related organelles complex 1 subunit 2